MSREIDAQVAEEVMGWIRCGKKDHTKPRHRKSRDFPGTIINCWDSKGPHDRLESPNGETRIFYCGCENIGEELPHYSTDYAAAFLVVDKFKHVIIARGHSGVWGCTIRIYEKEWLDNKLFIEYADTAPMAIALASLQAVRKLK